MVAWPVFCDGLMNTVPGSIDRRYPKYWSQNEGGIDWIAGANNNIISLTDGEVVGCGYFCPSTKQWFSKVMLSCPDSQSGGDYGVVTIRVTNSDSSKTDLYYQHIVISPTLTFTNSGSKGQKVKKGQLLGFVNPVGNIEMGVNVGSAWGGIWGNNSPGPHVDPEPYLRRIINAYASGGSFVGPSVNESPTSQGSMQSSLQTGNLVTTTATKMASVSSQAHQILNNVPGFLGIVEALDKVEQFQPYNPPASGTSTTIFDNSNVIILAAMDAFKLATGIDLGIPNLDLSSVNWLNPVIAAAAKAFQLATGIDLTNTDTILKETKSAVNTIQAFLQFMIGNTLAFSVRALFVFVGIIILVALLMNMANSVSQFTTGQSLSENVGEAVSTASKVAA